MAALTRLGPHGFGARRYGSFAGRVASAVVVGATLARKKPAKRWHVMPSGVRVLATDERFAKLAAYYKIEQKETAPEPQARPVEARRTVAAPETHETAQNAPSEAGGQLLGAVPEKASPAVDKPAPVADLGETVARLNATARLIEEAAERERQREIVRRGEEAARIAAQALAVEMARREAERLARIIDEEDEMIVQLILALAA